MPRIATSILLIVSLAGVVSACQPREHHNETQQTGQTGQRYGGGGNGLRRICADDIAKYCQNADRKRRCLRENMDKLSADCKAALQAAIDRKHDKNNQNGSTGNGEE